MDNAADPLLRPPTQLPDYVYCVGYSRASRSNACGWHDFPAVQQEMVCRVPGSYYGQGIDD